jgi:deoxyribonuclease V
MRIPRARHSWSLTPKAAIALQSKLAREIVVAPFTGELRLVAGADMAFSRDGKRCVAGVVVYDVNEQAVVETTLAWRDVRFPYVPGLLSFREAPTVLAAMRKLRTEPDAFILDAQGLAHPRRIGLAAHVGLFIDRPTVGCAKSRLCGEHKEPAAAQGSRCRLLHKGDVIGAVVRTRANVKPVYVSVGHRVTLDDALSIVQACVTRYRLPEPTRLAHQLVTRERTKE